MSWFKKAENEKFIQNVKTILKSHPFTNALADYYNIPISDVDGHLQIQVTDLKGEFARGNGKLIRLDKKLLDRSFFKSNFHFVIHEFFHWLKRRSEELFYFNDPEEVQSFVLQMTWFLISKKTVDDINKEILPIIQSHFKDKDKAITIYNEMLQKAHSLYEIYQKSGTFSME